MRRIFPSASEKSDRSYFFFVLEDELLLRELDEPFELERELEPRELLLADGLDVDLEELGL
jgi:hypothetical protein